MTKTKIFLTLSLIWIVLVGYLTWFNKPKTFQWDEWVWSCACTYTLPFLIIWKPNEFAKFISCIKSLFNNK